LTEDEKKAKPEAEEATSDTEESQEQTIDVKELLEKIGQLESELKEKQKEIEGLHSMYEEMLENLKAASEEAEEEEESFPSFEDWLKDYYEYLKDEAKKKKKYPYYPEYPMPKKKESVVVVEKPMATEATEAKTEGSAEVVGEDSGLREKWEKVAESLRTKKGIKEVWTVPMLKTGYEIVGRAREFVKVVDLVKNKAGDVIYIPTVRDFDLGDWGTYGSPTLGDETGTDVIAFTSATVQEAGAKFYMKNHLVEKADSNVVETINEICRRAVLRAEDKKILADIYGTSSVLSLDKSGAGVDFDADWVAEIIGEFQSNGVDVSPGDIVLFICPSMHEALLKDIAGSLGLAFARPDVVQKGTLTEFMGVTIRVVSKSILPDDGTNYYAIAFKKGAYTLAPKRDFLIETDPDPANRQTLTVVTTAAAGALANPNYGMKIKTQVT